MLLSVLMYVTQCVTVYWCMYHLVPQSKGGLG